MHTPDAALRELAELSVEYVLKKQNSDGSWYFSSHRRVIDNVHTGFTVEGLCDAYLLLTSLREKARLGKSLLAAYGFYWEKLYMKTGYGREFAIRGPREAWLPLALSARNGKLWKSFLKFVFQRDKSCTERAGEHMFLRACIGTIEHKVRRLNLESRLHGYASGIRAFTKLSRILNAENKALIIADYVMRNLQTNEGAFVFRSAERRFYIRNEGHMFDALTNLLRSIYGHNDEDQTDVPNCGGKAGGQMS